MTTAPGEMRRTAAWRMALDEMEADLARRLAQAEEPAAPTDPGAAATPLQALDERLARMQTRLDQAERDASAADAVLRAEAEAYQRWTEGMTAARRRLADWTARAG